MFALPEPTTAADVARRLGECIVLGAPERAIVGVAPLEASSVGTLSFCSAVESAAAAAALAASAPGSTIIVADTLDLGRFAAERTLLAVPGPRLGFIRFTAQAYAAREVPAVGISPLASIAPGAQIAAGAGIAPFAVVEDGVVVGEGSSIGPHVHLEHGTRLGRNVHVQSQSVIGMIGTAAERDADGRFLALPHLAGVTIADGCRIGPATTIARGTLRDTAIDEGCLIGARVNIGHNCIVGRHSLLAVGSIMAGSSTLGEFCWIGPAALIANRVRVGRWSIIGMGSTIVKDCAEASYMVGNPARAMPHPTRFNKTGQSH